MKYWNKCSFCGQFISFEDFLTGEAKRQLISPDSEFTAETFENTCGECRHRSQSSLENYGAPRKRRGSSPPLPVVTFRGSNLLINYPNALRRNL